MFVYWALFAFFAFGTVLGPAVQVGRRPVSPMLAVGAVVTALLIGLRYEVGADWEAYKFIFSFAKYDGLFEQLGKGEWGYQFLNWSVNRIGAGIWLVNLACGAIFAWGLYRFVRVQLEPWLAFTIAVPYLVIVVGMGYTRQAVALGLLMAGLAAFEKGASVLRFAGYVAAAALFHKTAVVALPLVIFSSKSNRWLNLIAGLALTVLFYDVFLADSVGTYVRNYVATDYSSQGAAIRVAMNLVPAVLMLTFGKRLGFPPHEERVWRSFSYASVALLVLLFLLSSSTAVDRMALYIIPLQLAVLSRVFLLFNSARSGRVFILAYAFAIQFIWLNYAAHAEYWLPYQFHPIVD